MNDGWGYNDGGWGGWILMGLMMLVFWGVVAALVVYVIRNVTRRPTAQPGAGADPGDPALRILDERFARGEIDADEYGQRRNALLGR